MKTLPVLLLGALAPVLAGCQTSPTAIRAGDASSGEATAEGTIVAVEEGYLLLDLPDGTRKEIGTVESIMPMDKLLPATGRKCRVGYRTEQVEEIDGSVRTAFLMTKFEWL